MLKKKISVMLVALMLTFAIPGMAFASEEAAADPSCGVSSDTVSTESGESNTSEKDITVTEDSDAEDVADATNGEITNTEKSVEAVTSAESEQEGEPNSNVIAEDENEGTEAPDVEEPATEAPAVEEPVIETPTAEEPAIESPVVEEPVIETPVVEEPVIPAVVPEDSTLIIHHIFEYGDVVCDDYETIEKLTTGEVVNFGEYSYEDKYIFANCINGSDSLELQAGENCIIIKYTLKNGYKLV